MIYDNSIDAYNKQTVQYVIGNANHIKSVIQKALNKRKFSGSRVSSAVVDEVYDSVMQNFEKAEDFDPERGCNIRNYINSGIENVVKRYYSEISNHYKRIDTDEEKKNKIPDKDIDDFNSCEVSDMDTLCKSMLHKRYLYGTDIFLMSYLVIRLNYNKDLMNMCINQLNIDLPNKSDRRMFEKDDICRQFMFMLTKDVKNIEVLRKYIYGIEFIDKLFVLSYKMVD